MKKMARIIAATLTGVMVALLAAGCGESGVEQDLTPLKGYETPITISVGRENNAGGSFAEGQNVENNGWVNLLKEELNIVIDVKNGFDVIGGEYDNTLALRIASDTLPDTFGITGSTTRSMMLFKQLVEGGKLADLTNIYNNAIGGRSKEYLNTLDTKKLLKHMTIDDKIYGITGGGEAYNTALLFIRKDWLDKCGLQVPKTLDEVANVALEFVKQKPGGMQNTIGIALNPSPNDGMFGQWMGILPVFNAFGAYPDIWIANSSGQVVNGAIQPETKAALGLMAEWVKSGVLDKNMITMKDGDEVRDTYISTNACGMIFNAWWDPWVQWDGYQNASVKFDESIEWLPVMAPLNGDGKFIPKNESNIPGGQVVNVKYPNPEAIVKAMNLLAEVEIFKNPAYETLRQKYIVPIEGTTDLRTNNPFKFDLVTVQGRLLRASTIKEYLETGTLNLPPVISGDLDYINGAYDWVNNNTMADWYKLKNEDEVDKYMFQYVGHWAYDVLGSMYVEAEKSGVYKEMPQAFSGITESQADYGAMLNDLRNTAFLQIISGEKPLDYFDEFVAQWKTLGGDIITAEVNETAGKN